MIPAVDSLRHERVGLVSNSQITAILKAYVKTEETSEIGAYDPIEGFARPFPLMYHSGNQVVSVENSIDNAELTPFSDDLIGYISLLHQSMEEQEWVDGVENFNFDVLPENEQKIAESLLHSAAKEMPRELYRLVYKPAAKGKEELVSDTLRDIEDHSRYNYNYLPKPNDVDEWSLQRFMSEEYIPEKDQTAVSESIWLRYSVGGSKKERPIIEFQNNVAGVSVASEKVSFGNTTNFDVTEDLVQSILSESGSVETSSYLISMDPSQLDDTRTLEYLEDFLN